MSVKAMKLALEALENASPAAWASRVDSDTMKSIWRKHLEALEGLRVLLAELDNASCKSVQKRLEAQQPATDEPVGSRNPFASRCYTMSESHLSGHRLIVGFERLGDAQDAHEWVARQARGDFTHPAPSVPADVVLDCYDAGILNDFGGGNVEWWQDYIRAELGDAHNFYQSQIDAALLAASPGQEGNGMSIEAMELALAALENTKKLEHLQDYGLRQKAIDSVRTALSQQPDNAACKSVQKRLAAQQPATPDPVAWNSIQIASWIGSQLMHEPVGQVFYAADGGDDDTGAGYCMKPCVHWFGKAPDAGTKLCLHRAPIVPDGWREIFESARNQLQHAEPSSFDNSGYRSYASNVLDVVEDELEAIDAAMLAAKEGGAA